MCLYWLVLLPERSVLKSWLGGDVVRVSRKLENETLFVLLLTFVPHLLRIRNSQPIFIILLVTMTILQLLEQLLDDNEVVIAGRQRDEN